MPELSPACPSCREPKLPGHRLTCTGPRNYYGLAAEKELMPWTMTRETARILLAALDEAIEYRAAAGAMIPFEHARAILTEVLEKHGLRVCPFRADPHTLAECLSAEHERSEG